MTLLRPTCLMILLVAMVGCAAPEGFRGGYLSNVIVEPRLDDKLAGDRERPLALGTLLGVYAGTSIGRVLTPEDQRIAEETALVSLASAPDGEIADWNNPNTGHNGTFAPVLSYVSEDGLTCRDYNLGVSVDGQSRAERGAACLTQGEWWTVSVPIRSSTRRGNRR